MEVHKRNSLYYRKINTKFITKHPFDFFMYTRIKHFYNDSKTS